MAHNCSSRITPKVLCAHYRRGASAKRASATRCQRAPRRQRAAVGRSLLGTAFATLPVPTRKAASPPQRLDRALFSRRRRRR